MFALLSGLCLARGVSIGSLWATNDDDSGLYHLSPRKPFICFGKRKRRSIFSVPIEQRLIWALTLLRLLIVFDSYLIGYSLIALGSVCIFLSQFHRMHEVFKLYIIGHQLILFLYTVSNAFPRYSGVILAALTGAFDASSVPYLIYREVYFAFGGRPSL
jgi:hypothetical protein